MAKTKDADRENPAKPANPALERKRARGQTEAQKQMREWDEGGYQDTDPVTGKPRGPLAPHAMAENQGGPVGPTEGEEPDYSDDPDMRTPAAARRTTTATKTTNAARAAGGDVDATDAARDLAKTEGVDLSSVKGSGADGRITIDDVRAAADK